MVSFHSTVRAPNNVDIIAPNSICVFGIDSAIGDAALEPLPCCAAMVPEGVEDSVELGIFVSVARVMVLVAPWEATTTTEVPI